MIVVKRDDYVQGSTALVPQRQVEQPKRKNEELDRRKRELKKKNVEARVKKKAKILMNVGLTFVIGTILIGRFSLIYNEQKELNAINGQINNVSKENENLKVELVKYNNLKFIEENATNKLKMVVPDKSDAVYVSLDKENFNKQGETSSSAKGESKSKSVMDMIKSILFF